LDASAKQRDYPTARLACRIIPPILCSSCGSRSRRSLSHRSRSRGSLPPSFSPDESLAPSPERLGAGLYRAAAPGLAGVTRLHRRRCDETERFDVARGLRPLHRSTPSPLTLLPAARSPSRPHYCRPLVGSYPTVSALIPSLCSGQALRQARDGYTFCCGCSRPARLAACRTPSLAFS